MQNEALLGKTLGDNLITPYNTTHTHTRTNTHTCKYMHAHTHTHARAHTHTHTHTHTIAQQDAEKYCTYIKCGR